MEGRIYGRYRVTRRLAVGGMGEVYAVTHELTRGEAVVKVLLPEMSAKTAIVKRFLREAEAVAAITHPGIVRVFDMGYTDDGRAYIVMERLQGQTLRDRLMDVVRLDAEKTRAFTIQLARAMSAAHDAGIVHRDLKPDNIFIVPDPDVLGGERIKVLDFGLAKDVSGSADSLVTITGAVFGTPAYMAPEQCTDAGTVDHRADLYAIGCIMYSCLCGQPPFGRGGIQLIAAHLRDTPLRPRASQPSVPDYLDAIVMRLLAKRPEDRLQTCHELVAALEQMTPLPALPRPASGGAPIQTLEAQAETIRRPRPGDLAGDLAGAPRPGRPPIGPGTAGTGPSSIVQGTIWPAPGAEAPAWPGDPVSTLEPPHLATSARAGHELPSSPTVDRATSVLDSSAGKPGRSRKKGLAVASGVAVVAAITAALALLLPGDRDDPTTDEPSEASSGESTGNENPALSPEHIDRLLGEARAAVEDERWDEAIIAAEKVLTSNPEQPEARRIRGQAKSEKDNLTSLTRLEEVADDSDFAAVAAAYRKIAENSIYHDRARAIHEKQGASHGEELLGRADKLVADKDCDAIAALRDEAETLWPPVVAELSTRRDRCVEDSKVASTEPTESKESKESKKTHRSRTDSKQDSSRDADYDQYMAATRDAIRKGLYGAALRSCRQAYKARATDEAVLLCGLSACKAKSISDARRFHDKASGQSKNSILAECLRSGLDPSR